MRATFDSKPRVDRRKMAAASSAVVLVIGTLVTGGGESDSLSGSSSVVSLLDRLKPPVPSELARKMKVLTNPQEHNQRVGRLSM